MKQFLVLFLVVLAGSVHAQSLFLCKQMYGPTTDSTADIWVELSPVVEKVEFTVTDQSQITVFNHTYVFTGPPEYIDYRPLTMQANHLKPGNSYTCSITAFSKNSTETIGDKLRNVSWTNNWQSHQPFHDFSFITGSCALIVNQAWDSTGVLYKGDTSIFYRMAKTPADFMLWLGDNWYTHRLDIKSVLGLSNKAHWTRNLSLMECLQPVRPNYAIWDDHDYGPDDGGHSYKFREGSRTVFMNYWPLPSYGEDGKGIYTQFTYNKVAFFLLDDRTWRSTQRWWSYLKFPIKRQFGKQQMAWLKRSLLEHRDAPFKVIATGTQMVTPSGNRDCFHRYPKEYKELMFFLADNRINGVIFLTGDRHFSEIIKLDREGHYPLYDLTISPFTSDVAHPKPKEVHTKYRVPGTLVEDHNFSKISISGTEDNPIFHADIINTRGQTVAQWEVTAKELTEP